MLFIYFKLRPYEDYTKDDWLNDEKLSRNLLKPSVVQLNEENERLKQLRNNKLSFSEFLKNINSINTKTEEKVKYLIMFKRKTHFSLNIT